jgi:hypothetical protein
MYDIEKMNAIVGPAMEKLELVLQKIVRNPQAVLDRASFFSGEMSELLSEPSDGFYQFTREEDGQQGLVVMAMAQADVPVAASHPQAARMILSGRVDRDTGKVDQFYMSYFDGRRAREVFPQINPQLAPQRILSLLPRGGLSLAALYDFFGAGLVDRLGELVGLEEADDSTADAPVAATHATCYRLGGDTRLLSLHPVSGDLSQPSIIMAVNWITDISADTAGLPVPIIRGVELSHISVNRRWQSRATVLALCALWKITEIIKRRRDHVAWRPSINNAPIEIVPSGEICQFIYNYSQANAALRGTMDSNRFAPKEGWVEETLRELGIDLEIP